MLFPRLKRRSATDYPGVDPVKFDVWHRADMKFAVALIAAGIGGPVLWMLSGVVLALMRGESPVSGGTSESLDVVGLIVGLVTLLCPIIWAAVFEHHARRLKKEAGIAR